MKWEVPRRSRRTGVPTAGKEAMQESPSAWFLPTEGKTDHWSLGNFQADGFHTDLLAVLLGVCCLQAEFKQNSHISQDSDYVPFWLYCLDSEVHDRSPGTQEQNCVSPADAQLGSCGPSFRRFLQCTSSPPETLEKSWRPPRCYMSAKQFNALRQELP